MGPEPQRKVSLFSRAAASAVTDDSDESLQQRPVSAASSKGERLLAEGMFRHPAFHLLPLHQAYHKKLMAFSGQHQDK